MKKTLFKIAFIFFIGAVFTGMLKGQDTNSSTLILAGNKVNLGKVSYYALNGEFSWGYPKDNERTRQGIADCKKAGIRHFLWCGHAALSQECFDKDKRLTMPYCLVGPMRQQLEKMFAETARNASPGHYTSCSLDEMGWNNMYAGYGLYGPKKSAEMIPEGTPFYCNCEECQKAFRKETDMDLPEIGPSRLFKTNTTQVRRFILWRYETFARALAGFVAKAQETNPKGRTMLTLSLASSQSLERYPQGLAIDVIDAVSSLTLCKQPAFKTSVTFGVNGRTIRSRKMRFCFGQPFQRARCSSFFRAWCGSMNRQMRFPCPHCRFRVSSFLSEAIFQL